MSDRSDPPRRTSTPSEQRRSTQPAFEQTRVERPIDGKLPVREDTRDDEVDRPLAVGALIGHVRLTGVLGVGGMGRVYRGIDQRLDRAVAVKTIRRRHRRDAVARERLRREARILSRLNHPGICQLYELIEGPEADYLVLELIEGRSLRSAIEEGLTKAERLAIAEQIADALTAAHLRGIVHRDLKPDNVMLTADGAVKVLDFGIARTGDDHPVGGDPDARDSSEADAYETVAGTVIGTARYMSPEQARGEPVTPASDLYSFGLVLLELSRHGPPPEPGSPAEELARAGRGRPSMERRARRGSMRTLIDRLTEQDPAVRPTAAEARHRLRRLRDAPRRIATRAALIAVGVLAAAGVAKYTVDLRESQRQADEARESAEALVGFMLEDLQQRLEPLGRLDAVESVARRALDHFSQLPPSSTEAAGPRATLARRQVGEVLLARGDLTAALATFHEALAIDRARLALQPGSTDALAAVVADLQAIGSALELQGNLDQALVSLEEAAGLSSTVAGRAPAARWQRERAAISTEIAEVLRQQGHRQESAARLDEAIEWLETTVAVDPDDPESATSLAELHYARGLAAHFDEVDLDTADRHYRRAIELLKRTLAAGHHSAQRRFRLGVLHGQGLCQLAISLDRPAEAEAACAEARAILDRLNQDDPSIGRYANGALWEHLRAASLYEWSGKPELVAAEVDRAVAIGERMVSPGNVPTDWISSLASALSSAADIRWAAGDQASAIAALSRAESLFAQAVTASPSDLFQRGLRLGAAVEVAVMREAAGQAAEAREAFERADGLARELDQQAPQPVSIRADLALALARVGCAAGRLEALGDPRPVLARALEIAAPLAQDPAVGIDDSALIAVVLARSCRGEESAAREALRLLERQGWTPADGPGELVALAARADP